MLTVYVSPSCSSCRKVKDWLTDHKIEFKEKNIFSAVLNENELKDMLAKTENGTEDIISTPFSYSIGLLSETTFITLKPSDIRLAACRYCTISCIFFFIEEK